MFRRLFASLPAIVFGVLIAVAPQAFAHVCEVKDNMPMACHYTAQAELGIGVVIALLGIIALFCSPKIRTGLNIAVALNALLSLAVPTVLIGVQGRHDALPYGHQADAHRDRHSGTAVRRRRHLP